MAESLILSCPSWLSRHLGCEIFLTLTEKYLPELRVEKVTPLKKSGRYPCRWRVLYRLKNPMDQFSFELLQKIGRHKPKGTNVMKPEYCKLIEEEGVSYEIEYGMLCQCPQDFYEEEAEDDDDSSVQTYVL
ncbi:unnamed protein product [Tenebrio molitor]|jgi:hypothetical protein|nr:unnamed protein product [Tenebrio molitor]